MKHKKLSQTEIEQERVQNEQEVRLRSIADSEERRNEKQVRAQQSFHHHDALKVKKPVPKSSKEVKGTVKSTSSWSNDQFGKIYEPVSATELRRQHQVWLCVALIYVPWPGERTEKAAAEPFARMGQDC